MSETSATEFGLNGTPDLFSIRGIAVEAVQIMRSHEELDDIRFKNQDQRMVEIRDSLKELTTKVEEGFKRNDNRFWSLGISFITMLMSCCGFLIWEIVSRTHG